MPEIKEVKMMRRMRFLTCTVIVVGCLLLLSSLAYSAVKDWKDVSGTVYVLNTDGNLYKDALSGTQVRTNVAQIAATSDRLYILLNDGYVYDIASSAYVWHRVAQIAATSDRLYILLKDGRVYDVVSGKQVWTKTAQIAATSGRLYLKLKDGRLYEFNGSLGTSRAISASEWLSYEAAHAGVPSIK
jgi:hypothetical protein